MLRALGRRSGRDHHSYSVGSFSATEALVHVAARLKQSYESYAIIKHQEVTDCQYLRIILT